MSQSSAQVNAALKVDEPLGRRIEKPPPPTPPVSKKPLFNYQEGGKRPRSVRVETFRPLHQPCFHEQPRTGTASSSGSQPSRSQSSPSLGSADVELGKALRTLWQLQGVGFRKPCETASCVAPALVTLEPPRPTAPSTAPAGARHRQKSHERRCDEVLSFLVRDSDTWGRVQEKQARLVDANRDLVRKDKDVRNETMLAMMSSSNHLSQSFSNSQALWRSRTPATSFHSNIAPSYKTAYDEFYGLENAHRLAKLRGNAKTTHGHETYRAFTMWGAEPSVERTNC